MERRLDPADLADGVSAGAGTSPRRSRKPKSKRRRITQRVLLGVLVVFAGFFGWAAWSIHQLATDSPGEPLNVVVAEWGRDHHMGSLVAFAENIYYNHFATVPVGGKPTESTVIAGGQPTSPGVVPTLHRPQLMPPPTLVSPVGSPLPMEGVWQPVGSIVDGVHAIYVTRVRPDNVHTSVLASLMWIDTKLVRAMFVPGYKEPGGPNPSQGALPKQFWPLVLANFNGGFRLQDSQGGYYYEGHMVKPLVAGKASAVITSDGSLTVGAWGRDVAMTPNTAVVQQNLALIVDHGKSMVSGNGGGFQWGATTDGGTYAWRSALGVRADGSLVYIGSPGLSAATLANTLVHAGVVRAMVLDMNNWWVAGFYFNHTASGQPVCHKLDPNIAESCNRFLQRYKRQSFQILAAP
jgi:hypothetical protein